MVDPIEQLGLIRIDQRCFIVVFYTLYDLAEQVNITLNCSSLHSTNLLQSQQNLGN